MISTHIPSVTVCVPVHNGGRYLAETLESIKTQTYRQLTVLISDDASNDDSVAICRGFSDDARFHFTVQPARLGWVENCNWLLSNAQGELICIVPHDDIIAPHYVEALVDCLVRNSAASLSFCDIEVFGMFNGALSQVSIRGSAVERLQQFIRLHHDGTAFRGLIRREALAEAGGLRSNRVDNFAADVTWLARIARTGSLEHVPQTLYRKRFDPESVSRKWGRWSDDDKIDAWCVHCRELLEVALGLDPSREELHLMVAATLRRLLAIEPTKPFSFIRRLQRRRKALMLYKLLQPFDRTRVGRTIAPLIAAVFAEKIPASGWRKSSTSSAG